MSGGAHDHQRAMVKILPGARAARLLALVLAAHALPCALPNNPAASSSDHDPSAEQAEVDRGVLASLDVRCDVCRTLLADLSAVAAPVRQQLEAEGTTTRSTTVAETTAKSIAGMCEQRGGAPGLLGLYKIHDCTKDDVHVPGPLEAADLNVGDFVALGERYEGDQAPLLRGQMGRIVWVDADEDKVLVTAVNDTREWYPRPALDVVRIPACVNLQARQRYVAEHYANVSAAAVAARADDEGARRDWEVYAHRIMCAKYWTPLATDIGEAIEDANTSDIALEYCVEKGLCQSQKQKRKKKQKKKKKSKQHGTSSEPEL